MAMSAKEFHDLKEAEDRRTINEKADEWEKVIDRSLNSGSLYLYKDVGISVEVQKEIERRYLAVGWSKVLFSHSRDTGHCITLVL